eukprot:1034262-Pyramimonas_sp.AAC.2
MCCRRCLSALKTLTSSAATLKVCSGKRSETLSPSTLHSTHQQVVYKRAPRMNGCSLNGGPTVSLFTSTTNTLRASMTQAREHAACTPLASLPEMSVKSSKGSGAVVAAAGGRPPAMGTGGAAAAA